jgi:4-aminobutyrate aminotransferase/(S)-3-amino-2-methylpropionate transaminase
MSMLPKKKQGDVLTSHENIVRKDREYLIQCTLRQPLVLVEGKNALLKDINGKEYIDCFSGISVVNVGHCHPKVVEAAKKQLDKLIHCSGVYHSVPQTLLAEKLALITPRDLKKIFFCNSGAEAVEGAIKLTKKYALKRGRAGLSVIALQGSFHGRTALALTLTGQKKYKVGLATFADYPGVVHAPTPYCYRCNYKYPDCGIACACFLEDILELSTAGDVAALIAEPILGEGGVIVPPKEYWETVPKICRDHDIPLIIDEVQTGFGRTGAMFASEHWDIQPDIMTMAKGLGGGMPIGAFIAKDEIAAAFDPGDHFSTFGGNPVSCAAALANISVLIDEKFPEKVMELGEYTIKRLREIAEKREVIGDVRGKGLMIGVELVKDRTKNTPDPEAANKIRDKMRERGVLIGVGGIKKCTLRLQPCLTITREQMDKVLEILESALKKVGVR